MRPSKRAIGILVALLLTCALAACGQTFRVATPQGTATCKIANNGQGGNCSVNGHTVSIEPGAGHSSTQRTPVPVSSPVTPSPSPVTTSATPSPSNSFDSSSVQAVQNCMNQFPTQTRDTLVSFSTDAGARQNMGVCLQIPPQTMALFLRLLFKYAYEAYIHGDFNSTQGQQQFTSSEQGDTLPAAVVRCDHHYN